MGGGSVCKSGIFLKRVEVGIYLIPWYLNSLVDINLFDLSSPCHFFVDAMGYHHIVKSYGVNSVNLFG